MDIQVVGIHPFGFYRIPFPCVNTSHCHHIELHFNPGTYRVELWGAGSTSGGGYVSGEIHFFSPKTLYCFIGGAAPQTSTMRGMGGYNGGGTSQVIRDHRQIGGDGGTDLRLETENLSSRIIVAGGAGGGRSSTPGGYGGGLIGGNGSTNAESDFIIGQGGNQTMGGIGQYSGEYGIGAGSIPGISTDLAGCGGGGWYGGGSGYHYELSSSGGGGSSYISGIHGCENHYSGFAFYNPIMISGNLKMPSPNGGFEKGPFGNGFVLIASIDPQNTCGHISSDVMSPLVIFFLLLAQSN